MLGVQISTDLNAGKSITVNTRPSTLIGLIAVCVCVGTPLITSAWPYNSGQIEYAENNKKPLRLTIVDAAGNVIAKDKIAYDLLINPHVFWQVSNSKSNQHRVLAQSDLEKTKLLTEALETLPNIAKNVEEKLSNSAKSKKEWVNLAWTLPADVATRIDGLKLQGIKTTKRLAREYPENFLYAHVVGFTQASDNSLGQEGLEYFFNQRITASNEKSSPIKLTLDTDFQKLARAALQKGIAKHQATGGAIVVLDANTHDIKSMVSLPDFDPNDSSTFRNPYKPEVILNRATALNFPTGDLLTPLLAAHGLEVGQYDLNAQFKVGGKFMLGKAELIDLQTPTTQTVEGIVARKNEISFSKIALGLPLVELEAMTKKFGLGQPCNIAGATCINKSALPFNEWTPSMQLQPGRRIETNMLQILKAYTPFANGGEISIPRLLHSSNHHTESTRVISLETANKIKNMLELSAKANPESAFSNWSVTVASKSSLIKGLYETNPETSVKSPRNDVATLIAILPANKPKYLVGVLLEFPRNKGVDADVSAQPIVINLMGNYLK